jgi:hypothetical protein
VYLCSRGRGSRGFVALGYVWRSQVYSRVGVALVRVSVGSMSVEWAASVLKGPHIWWTNG